MNEEKRCKGVCGQVKPLDQFARQKHGKYGRRAQCKVCTSVREGHVPKVVLPFTPSEKLCSGPCGQVKALDEFHDNPNCLYGKAPRCKQCVSQHQKKRRKTHPEEVRAVDTANRERNKPSRAASQKVCRERKLDEYNAKSRAQYYKNREVRLAKAKDRGKKKRSVIRVYMASYMRRRLLEDPAFKLVQMLRGRLRSALRGRSKAASTMALVGCTRNDLMVHLQKGFRSGYYEGVEYTMEWNNYGPVFHVDHIRPISLFDLSDPEQQKACFHYSNLQPLFWWENLSKGNRYEESV